MFHYKAQGQTRPQELDATVLMHFTCTAPNQMLRAVRQQRDVKLGLPLRPDRSRRLQSRRLRRFWKDCRMVRVKELVRRVFPFVLEYL
jgi:hypothetical protein